MTELPAPLPPDRRDLTGPFDIIGDVHGCADELRALLGLLGYALDGAAPVPPPGRLAVFLGDLVDRGPKIAQVLRWAMGMVAAGTALCVAGNHDAKLVRQLLGRNVRLTNGLAVSVEQLAAEPPEFRQQVLEFLAIRPIYLLLDAGRLVVAHGGLKESLHGRNDGVARSFALFGATTGHTDADGLPVRLDWAADYHGAAMVVYGHTPVPEPVWVNNTINIDTGCVFGGRLTALRYPEQELVSVPAARAYADTRRKFLPPTE
jgi:protein phosphatase